MAGLMPWFDSPRVDVQWAFTLSLLINYKINYKSYFRPLLRGFHFCLAFKNQSLFGFIYVLYYLPPTLGKLRKNFSRRLRAVFMTFGVVLFIENIYIRNLASNFAKFILNIMLTCNHIIFLDLILFLLKFSLINSDFIEFIWAKNNFHNFSKIYPKFFRITLNFFWIY